MNTSSYCVGNDSNLLVHIFVPVADIAVDVCQAGRVRTYMISLYMQFFKFISSFELSVFTYTR